MLFLGPDLVVLDPWAAVAAEYSEHQPRRDDFRLARPYQAPAASADQPSDSPEGATEGPGSQGAASPPLPPPPPAAADEAQQQQQEAGDADTAGSPERDRSSKRKKRARRGGRQYQPNERELEAAARHATQAPLLATAADAVASWLRASGAATVQEALSAAAGSQPAAAQQAGEQPGGHRRPGEQPGGEAAPAPDFRSMHELRHALKPKLQFAAEPGGGAGAEAAGSPERRQDVQQPPPPPPPCNLFGCLVDSCGGGWSGGRERLAHAGGHPVLLPPRSRFLMSDARQLQPLVDEAAGPAGGYHCIVLDPPWENASARRSARYPTLPSRNLLGLPMRALMAGQGCLVAMWVTNRERHRRFIDQKLLPGWGLRHLATWHWLKVTDGGQLVSRLDVEHRRPYESLLLCWPAHLPPPPGSDSGDDDCSSGGSGGGFRLLQGRPLVVAAVPPAQHSRKPHLGPLLLPLLPPQARCLELFARELHAGWTSWGNEVLKFQGTGWFV